MKQLFLVMVMAVAFGFAANAQRVWATIKVPQIKCWECKDKLEKYLLKEKGPTGNAGILQWNIYQASGTVRIQYLANVIDLNYIKTAIANAGFDADEIKAEETSYKKLPPACKRVEDGGGPQKGQPCAIPAN